MKAHIFKLLIGERYDHRSYKHNFKISSCEIKA